MIVGQCGGLRVIMRIGAVKWSILNSRNYEEEGRKRGRAGGKLTKNQS